MAINLKTTRDAIEALKSELAAREDELTSMYANSTLLESGLRCTPDAIGETVLVESDENYIYLTVGDIAELFSLYINPTSNACTSEEWESVKYEVPPDFASKSGTMVRGHVRVSKAPSRTTMVRWAAPEILTTPDVLPKVEGRGRVPTINSIDEFWTTVVAQEESGEDLYCRVRVGKDPNKAKVHSKPKTVTEAKAVFRQLSRAKKLRKFILEAISRESYTPAFRYVQDIGETTNDDDHTRK